MYTNILYNPNEALEKGNLFKNIYQPYLDKNIKLNPLNEQAKLLTKIDSLTFALIDLNLYLDIYPDDNEMIKLYNNYKNELIKITNEYENKYNVLSLESESINKYPWSWNDMPWPWN